MPSALIPGPSPSTSRRSRWRRPGLAVTSFRRERGRRRCLRLSAHAAFRAVSRRSAPAARCPQRDPLTVIVLQLAERRPRRTRRPWTAMMVSSISTSAYSSTPAEGERAQERAQCRGRVRVRVVLAHPAVAQQRHVVDAVRAGDHPRDQRVTFMAGLHLCRSARSDAHRPAPEDRRRVPVQLSEPSRWRPARTGRSTRPPGGQMVSFSTARPAHPGAVQQHHIGACCRFEAGSSRIVLRCAGLGPAAE